MKCEVSTKFIYSYTLFWLIYTFFENKLHYIKRNIYLNIEVKNEADCEKFNIL